MLSRFISKPSRHLLLLTRYISTNLSCPVYPSLPPSHSPSLLNPSRCIPSPFYGHRRFSSGNGDNSNTKDPPKEKFWSLSAENDELNVFGNEGVDLRGMGVEDGVEQESKGRREEPSWTAESGGAEGDVLQGLTNEFEGNGGGANEWAAAAGDDFQAWKLEEDEKEEVFDIGGVTARKETAGARLETLEEPEDLENKAAEIAKLNEEEEKLKVVIKGPNRAFGDLIAASGITDAMLDSLMALKNFEDIEGLPPLSEIEDLRYEKTTRKSSRYEMERLKQEEAAKSRVRIVDEKDRAYGTGKRKCSIARVWVQPGEGKVLVNDKEFDVYFPMLDHRAALLRPFSETHTLGLWDVKCTVKGGGISGQVGAIRLGISRALQNWEPGLRGQLKEAGFLTRDSRVVERKKPGKAKARKSFQWVKR